MLAISCYRLNNSDDNGLRFAEYANTDITNDQNTYYISREENNMKTY